jgi:hypothetical protein
LVSLRRLAYSQKAFSIFAAALAIQVNMEAAGEFITSADKVHWQNNDLHKIDLGQEFRIAGISNVR